MKNSIISIMILLASLNTGHTQSTDTIYINQDLQLIELRDSVFQHISWTTSENAGRFPSNGLIITRNGIAVMVDTPMDNEQTATLVGFLKDSMSITIDSFVASHFHPDCIGGINYLKKNNIHTTGNIRTLEICRNLSISAPEFSFDDSLLIELEGLKIVCRYFGGGHTQDNIIVWIPESSILFGGCMVKSLQSTGLGNLKDAVVGEWDSTLHKILAAYPYVELVVPGHGSAGGRRLLYHTSELVEKQKRKQG